MKPVPKNVIYVPPLDGARLGLKYVGLNGANKTNVSSFANTLENFFLSVPYVNNAGPLSENLSLKPRQPPPQAQTFPSTSIAKLLENPHVIS